MRVGFKWIIAIAFTLVMLVFLMSLTAYQATGRSASIVTIDALKEPVLVYAERYDDLLASYPEFYEYFQDPGFAADAYDDPESLRSRIDAIPDAGDSSVEDLKTSIENVSMLVTFFSSGVHSILGVVVLVLGVVLVALGIPLVMLSRRAGRLAAPAICLAVASWVPLVIVATGAGSSGWIARATAAQSSEEAEVVNIVMAKFVDILMERALSIFGLTSFLALMLLLGAGAVYVILGLRGTS